MTADSKVERPLKGDNHPTPDLKISVTWSLELPADMPTFRKIEGGDCALGGRADSKIEIDSQGTFSLAEGAKACGGSR